MDELTLNLLVKLKSLRN